MLKDVECAASRLLNTMNVNVKELYSAMLDSMGKTGRDYRESLPAAGRSQSRGTQTLDQYSRDLTGLPESGSWSLVSAERMRFGVCSRP